MIDATAVGEIIAQYEKHGWKLRRALFSAQPKDLVNFPPGVELVDSDLDALWFSRQSKPDSESWELRRTTGSPFALIAVIPTTASANERDEILSQVEHDMRGRTIA